MVSFDYSRSLPTQKKKRPTWETHDWSVALCNASYAGWLPPRPTVSSVVFLVFGGGWGLFVVSVFGSSRIGRCQSTSPWLLSLLCSTCALMH